MGIFCLHFFILDIFPFLDFFLGGKEGGLAGNPGIIKPFGFFSVFFKLIFKKFGKKIEKKSHVFDNNEIFGKSKKME